MSSAQDVKRLFIINKKIEIRNLTSSGNSTGLVPAMYMLSDGTKVCMDFHDRIERHVDTLLRSRPYSGRAMKMRDFFLPGFWRALTTMERGMVGPSVIHILLYTSKHQEA